MMVRQSFKDFVSYELTCFVHILRHLHYGDQVRDRKSQAAAVTKSASDLRHIFVGHNVGSLLAETHTLHLIRLSLTESIENSIYILPGW